jgi:hypothetical protein
MIEATEYDAPNPFFTCKEWKFAEDIIARIYIDKLGHMHTQHELYDGKRWYTVPKEILELFIRALQERK